MLYVVSPKHSKLCVLLGQLILLLLPLPFAWETDHLWGLHVNFCVLTLSPALDDGFEYCPPTGPLPTTKIIWINRCLDKETRLDEDRFSICMTQNSSSGSKKRCSHQVFVMEATLQFICPFWSKFDSVFKKRLFRSLITQNT